MTYRSLVLCYHGIGDRWRHGLTVPADRFERQLRALLRLGYRPADAAGALDRRARALHVTFDDAFTSVLEVVPVLERLRTPATVFACTDLADDGALLAIPELAEHAAAYPDELRTMTWEQLRAAARSGVIEIGSHTRTHAHLTRVGDEQLVRELRDSRERIVAELGSCRFLAYPFGEEDARVNEAAREAGYEAAFGLPGDPTGANPMSMPRVGVYRKDTLLRLYAKTSAQLRRAAERIRR